jgi:glucan phosphoethanolaminetransferase (alkaline phosphatase superfamily)
MISYSNRKLYLCSRFFNRQQALMEIFWNTIAQYNEGTWQAQFIITLAGIALTLLLYRKPTLWVKRSMKIYMVFLNGWISTVYYLMYCGTRNYHHILAIFWGVIALIWLWDLFADYTPFERNPRYKMLVGVLYAMPFLYPLLSWARGMEFPMMTTTVMPCSVAAFTIGLLLAFSRKVNLLVILFLCHWALIAFSKVYIYKIPEDLLLASATVPAIYLFFKNYFDQNLHKETKPGARFMNWFLILVCIIVGILLSITLLQELAR